MAVKQFLSDETIFYTDDLDGSFGDKVLATANAVASGGGGGILVATASTPSGYDGQILDKTYAEIKEAFSAKIPVYLYTYIEETMGGGITKYTTWFEPLTGAEITYADGEYEYGVLNSTIAFYADSEDGVLYNGSTPPTV